jgi:Na+-translocating ferredoxin:NAD+ oxidoreductase RNF subunit RnfB
MHCTLDILLNDGLLGVSVLVPAVIGLGGLGIAFGVILAVASERLAVKIDPRVSEVLSVLPGINCGACGQPGCEGYAENVVAGKAKLTLCAPGGPDVAKKIAGVLGVTIEVGERLVAFCHCKGGTDTEWKFDYDGIRTCGAAALIAAGPIACNYGCLGFYDCIRVCKFDAFEVAPNGMPVVNPENCVACKACVNACPRGLFELVPVSAAVHILCSNLEKAKAVKDVCKVGCIGCTRCVKVCRNGAISMKEGLAVIDYSKGDPGIEPVEVCPVEVIQDYRYQDRVTWRPPAHEAVQAVAVVGPAADSGRENTGL